MSVIICFVNYSYRTFTSNRPFGSPEYVRISARKFRRGLPLPTTPKGLEKGPSYNGIMLWIKTVIDGGIRVHGTVQVNSKSTCAVMARDRLVRCVPVVVNKSPWYSTSTSHLGTRQVPLTSVLDKYLSPRYSTSTSHLGTRQVPLTSVLDKYLSPRYSTSTSHLGTRQVPLTSVLDKYLSPRYSTSTSHLGTRQVPLTSVLDKYLSPRYSTSTSHLGTRQVPLTSVLDKYLSPRYSTSTSHLGTRQVPLTIEQIRSESCVDQGIITHLSSLDLTRPSGRVGRSS